MFSFWLKLKNETMKAMASSVSVCTQSEKS